jgi:cytochrome o ubiquinol oxidase subunit 1
MVWLHHFFTMGAGADVNAFFGIASMLIGIPTGVKIYNWLFTMYGGRVRFSVPMHYALGFMLTFTIGGLTGVLLAIPPVDFVVHNSLFLVAHFHNVIIPGVVFAIMAGYTYWFPKAFGFTLDERLGKVVFWCWFVGFNLAFMPSYLLGFWGGTRRMQHISDPSWRPWLLVELIGALFIAAAIAFTVWQLLYSIKTREQRRDLTGDPWDGRTLEWLTLSPPPHYNFAVLPDVHGEEAYWHRKQEVIERAALIPEPNYQPIEMPLNTPTGIIVAFFTSLRGFAIIWYIWWLAIVGLIGAFAVFVWYAWRDEHEHVIPLEEVIANARERRRIRMEHLHRLSQST